MSWHKKFLIIIMEETGLLDKKIFSLFNLKQLEQNIQLKIGHLHVNFQLLC